MADLSVSVQMMSGEVMTFPMVDSLSELRLMVAERAKTCMEFLQLVHGKQVLCEPVDLKSLEATELSCIIAPSVPLIIKVLRNHDFHFRGLNEVATKNPLGVTGCNLLHASVLVGKQELVRFLLEEDEFSGINNFLGRSGYNALHLAAKEGQHAICRDLLSCQHFHAVNASTTCEGNALHLAAQHGKVEARPSSAGIVARFLCNPHTHTYIYRYIYIYTVVYIYTHFLKCISLICLHRIQVFNLHPCRFPKCLHLFIWCIWPA